MSNTKSFVWVYNPVVIAFLEVRYQECEMILKVDSGIAKEVRSRIAELNECGMYPNRETTRPDDPFVQFLISINYNWNARWRDFKTILDEIFGVYGMEYDPNKSSDNKWDTLLVRG